MKIILYLILAFMSFNLTFGQSSERSLEGEELYAIGLSHMKNGEFEIALKYYKELVTIDPEYALNYFALAQANYFLNNYDETILACTIGLRYDENETLLYYFRGLSYMKLNKKKLACEDFKNSHDLDNEEIQKYCFEIDDK